MQAGDSYLNQCAYMLVNVLPSEEGSDGAHGDGANLEKHNEAAPRSLTREVFCEVVGVVLGRLYGNMPLASQLYENPLIENIRQGTNEDWHRALVDRTEDWLLHEGFVRIIAGRKGQYILSRRALSLLSMPTSEGTVGVLLERVTAQYAIAPPGEKLRDATRKLIVGLFATLNV